MMEYEQFDSTMSDILSSGNGQRFTSWHRDELKELFEKIDDRKVLVDYINIFYSNIYLSDMLDGETEEVAELIGGTFKLAVQFK